MYRYVGVVHDTLTGTLDISTCVRFLSKLLYLLYSKVNNVFCLSLLGLLDSSYGSIPARARSDRNVLGGSHGLPPHSSMYRYSGVVWGRMGSAPFGLGIAALAYGSEHVGWAALLALLLFSVRGAMQQVRCYEEVKKYKLERKWKVAQTIRNALKII